MSDNDSTTLTTSTEKAALSPLVWGRSGEWWDNALLLSLAAAAVVAAVVFIVTGASIFAHKREAESANQELEKYKSETERKVSDARREGIDAGKAAADALLRAAELEKEASNSRERIAELEAGIAEANARAAEATWRAMEADVARLKLEAELAPRTISPDARKLLAERLKPFSGTSISVWVFPGGTPADAAPLANALVEILKDAGWSPRRSVSISGQTVPGIVVAAKAGSQSAAAAAQLVEALRKANINAELSEPYDADPNFGAATVDDSAAPPPTVIMRIGAKQ